MNIGLAVVITIVYAVWVVLDVSLRDILRPPDRHPASVEFTRKYRRLYHTAGFLIYLLIVGGGFVGFGIMEYQAGIVAIFIFGVVGLIWIKPPPSPPEERPGSESESSDT